MNWIKMDDRARLAKWAEMAGENGSADYLRTKGNERSFYMDRNAGRLNELPDIMPYGLDVPLSLMEKLAGIWADDWLPDMVLISKIIVAAAFKHSPRVKNDPIGLSAGNRLREDAAADGEPGETDQLEAAQQKVLSALIYEF